jgi:hypothetical protein
MHFTIPEVTVSPGRLLAVNEVKTLLGHIIVTYDIKFEEGKGVPRELCIAIALPNWDHQCDVQGTAELRPFELCRPSTHSPVFSASIP